MNAFLSGLRSASGEMSPAEQDLEPVEQSEVDGFLLEARDFTQVAEHLPALLE